MSTSLANPLDLRQIAPSERHALILGGFAVLPPDQTLHLINDHDPQALKAQLELRLPGLLDWKYLEQGPQVWRFEIGRKTVSTRATAGSCCSGGGCCG